MTTREGRLEQADNRWRLRFVRTFAHGREKVWRALTEAEHQVAWFPQEMQGERAVGATLQFVSREMPDMEKFTGEMLVYDPPSVLEFTWGDDVLRFELEAKADDTTVLTMTDTFTELGKAARDAAGWHACLDVLEASLDGARPSWSSEDRWREVHPGYVERLGHDASTIGPPQEWIDAHS
jgi:uncharacterized protein YndB with AHSA1/START domain